MNELERRMQALRPLLGEPPWSQAREQQIRAEVARNLDRRGGVRRQVLIAAALAAGVVLTLGLSRGVFWRSEPPPAPIVSTELASRFRNDTIVFNDGSRAAAISGDMQLATLRQAPGLVEAQLTRGAARFEVVRNPSREFVVRANNVRVSVLGTVFTVAHEGVRVHVAVLAGKVRVDWGTGSSVLVQDSEGVFPPLEDPSDDAPTVEPAQGASSAGGGSTAVSAAAPPARRWLELARAGDFPNAYVDLAKVGARGVRDVPEELLLAADVSRRAGHAAEAVTHLERLLAGYPRDSRAEVAAFTLGRVRLQLGRTTAAASAFEQVAATGGPLAEDAMYRAVLARRQAGEIAKATALRERYLLTYPGGRYREALQKQP